MPGSLDGEDFKVVDEAAQDVDAGSSPVEGVSAQDTDAGFDPIAVTRKALEDTAPKSEGDGASPGSDEGEQGEGDKPAAEALDVKDKDADKAPEPKAEEDAKLPFAKHPRWREVMGERNEARQRAAELEPDANAYREVRSFMADHSLEPQDVQEGFAIMAAMKTDPAKALEMLRPVVENLQKFVGERLPDDLQQRVEDGLTDEATARELARLRNEANHSQETARERQERVTADRERAMSQARADMADAFVADRRANDPDFAIKEPLLKGQIQEAIQRRLSGGGVIQTPGHVKEVMSDAYKHLTDHLKRLSPQTQRRVATVPRGVPSSTSSATAASPAPTNPVEVTRAVLARMRAG